MLCNTSPAAPPSQLPAEGWSLNPSTLSQVTPLSRLASRLAGLVPA